MKNSDCLPMDLPVLTPSANLTKGFGSKGKNVVPRITMNITPDGGFELWPNEQGRDLLVRELTALSAKSDHFHLGAFEGAEVGLSAHAYRPTDTVLHVGKVMFRPDDWDRTHFPHVMEDPPEVR
jgi:hypothetical protein